jgi:biopolymer transport protein ExbB
MDMIYNAFIYIKSGGIAMIPIIFVSLWVWGLIIERLLFFRRMEKVDCPMEGIRDLNGHTLPPAAATGLCAPAIRQLKLHCSGQPDLDSRILELYAMQQKNHLFRSLSLITVLATAAPLLGLFGTVTGMISTFEAITIFGTGNAKALAAGISEALVTTQSGLLVGIPALFMARLISQRARRLNNLLSETVMSARRCLT